MMLDDELDEALERAAARESVSKAELLRRYARERLVELPPLEEDPLWQMVGIEDDPDDDGSPVDINEVVYDRKAPR